MNWKHQLLFSLAGGLALMAIATLFEVECTMGEPGGVNEGGVGLPIPYAQCGVWGQSFSWWIVAFDYIVWSAVSFGVIRLVMRITRR